MLCCYRQRWLRSVQFVTVKLWYFTFSRFCFDLDAVFDVLFVGKILYNVVLSSRKELHCLFIAEELSILFHHHLMWNCDGIRQWTRTSFDRHLAVCSKLNIIFHLQVSFWMIECNIISLKKKLNEKIWCYHQLSTSLRLVFVSGRYFKRALIACSQFVNWYQSFLVLPIASRK